MAARGVLRTLQNGRLLFRCPGCDDCHQVTVDGSVGPRWGFNGDYERPTFTPSILVRGVRLDMSDEEMDRLFAEFKLPQDRERMLADKRIATVCHSFVTDGQISFLADCTHSMAGKVVPLPRFDD